MAKDIFATKCPGACARLQSMKMVRIRRTCSPLDSSFSRTRESRFVLRRISLDTRFRGYDGTQAASSFCRSSPHAYFRRRHAGHEGFRRVRFAHRSVSNCLAQRTQNKNSEDLPQRREAARNAKRNGVCRGAPLLLPCRELRRAKLKGPYT